MKYNKQTFAARDRTINIRVTKWEHAMIKQEADRFGLSVSAYLLGLALGFEHVGVYTKSEPEKAPENL